MAQKGYNLYIMDIAAAIKCVTHRLNKEAANDLKGNICSILRMTRLRPTNLDIDE